MSKEKKLENLIKWRCRSCGAINLESESWIKEWGTIIECLNCGVEYTINKEAN